MKYRSRFAIASSILTVARAGKVTKTRMMYGSNMSFVQSNDYLKFLMSNDLLTRNEKTQHYSITDKGMRFLSLYKDLCMLIPLGEPTEGTLEADLGKENHDALAHQLEAPPPASDEMTKRPNPSPGSEGDQISMLRKPSPGLAPWPHSRRRSDGNGTP
jgi:predicted transcriptional regulator